MMQVVARKILLLHKHWRQEKFKLLISNGINIELVKYILSSRLIVTLISRAQLGWKTQGLAKYLQAYEGSMW